MLRNHFYTSMEAPSPKCHPLANYIVLRYFFGSFSLEITYGSSVTVVTGESNEENEEAPGSEGRKEN